MRAELATIIIYEKKKRLGLWYTICQAHETRFFPTNRFSLFFTRARLREPKRKTAALHSIFSRARHSLVKVELKYRHNIFLKAIKNTINIVELWAGRQTESSSYTPRRASLVSLNPYYLLKIVNDF